MPSTPSQNKEEQAPYARLVKGGITRTATGDEIGIVGFAGSQECLNEVLNEAKNDLERIAQGYGLRLTYMFFVYRLPDDDKTEYDYVVRFLPSSLGQESGGPSEPIDLDLEVIPLVHRAASRWSKDVLRHYFEACKTSANTRWSQMANSPRVAENWYQYFRAITVISATSAEVIETIENPTELD